jgi:serine/threonine protein kinase
MSRTPIRIYIFLHGSAAGMAHLHEQQIIDGMFSPNSVLLIDQLEPMTADAGFRRFTDPTFGDRHICMAPETLGGGELSFSSDVYAFRVTTYLVVTGSRAAPIAPEQIASGR